MNIGLQDQSASSDSVRRICGADAQAVLGCLASSAEGAASRELMRPTELPEMLITTAYKDTLLAQEEPVVAILGYCLDIFFLDYGQ